MGNIDDECVNARQEAIQKQRHLAQRRKVAKKSRARRIRGFKKQRFKGKGVLSQRRKGSEESR